MEAAIRQWLGFIAKGETSLTYLESLYKDGETAHSESGRLHEASGSPEPEKVVHHGARDAQHGMNHVPESLSQAETEQPNKKNNTKCCQECSHSECSAKRANNYCCTKCQYLECSSTPRTTECCTSRAAKCSYRECSDLGAKKCSTEGSHIECCKLCVKKCCTDCSHTLCWIAENNMIRILCGCRIEWEERSSRAKKTFCNGFTMLSGWKEGCPCGFFATFSKCGYLQRLGRYRRGRGVGTSWLSLTGGSWLVTTPSQQQSVFLYPDLTTALVGEFSPEGVGKNQVEVCQVVGLAADQGILTPLLRSSGERLSGFCGSLTASVLAHPYLADPFEARTAEVRQSLIPEAGEGLFAKRRIRGGELICFFAGVQVDEKDHIDSEYSILLQGGWRLDIPQDIRSVYCATLGHKACHSFQPSAKYSWAVHPRFGLVRSLTALHTLEAGQEVTTDYRYVLHKAPEWYRTSLISYLVQSRGLTSQEATNHIETMMRGSQ